MEERRAQSRVPVELDARLGESEPTVRIVNLSPGGCTIMCAPHSRSVDEDVRLTFQLRYGSKKFCLIGRVKWCDTELVGIEFSDCTLSQEIDLSAFVLKASVQCVQVYLWKNTPQGRSDSSSLAEPSPLTDTTCPSRVD